MPLYIYVTEHNDTLRKIADKYYCDIENLLSINPFISNSYLNLAADVHIKLPAPLLHVRKMNEAVDSCPPESSAHPLDQWIPLTSVEQMAQTDYDVLIIGSGAGGGAALWRLCEQWGQNGKRIGMIEAGDLQLPTHAFNLPTLNEQRAIEYWERIAERPGQRWPDYPGTKMVKALGGRTLLWYLFSPRFNPSAFRYWPITYKDLMPYYEIAERVMNITSDYAKGSSLQEMLLERLLMGGFPEAADIRMAVDLIGTKYGQVHSNVFFSSIDFLAYALNIRKFDLAVNTRAIQILTENGKAAGVKVMTSDKRSFTLKARTIIVSASTWETPRLLLNSNIPNEAIGRYIVHHPEYVAIGCLNRDQFPEVLGIATIVVPGSSERNYQLIGFSDFFYHYTEKPLLNKTRIVTKVYGIVKPRFENHVSLDSLERDAYGVPLLNIQFSYSDEDRALFHKMYASLLAFSTTMGLSLESPPLMSPTGYDNHECGTCRMGDNPATSVTNRFGQVHDISGLYIADNSVVNLSSPANPTLTTIALAMRTADYISEQMK